MNKLLRRGVCDVRVRLGDTGGGLIFLSLLLTHDEQLGRFILESQFAR